MKLSEAAILIADDEPELLDIFSTWLRRTGATVFTAVNGAEALKLLQSQPVDALISDVRMPIMDGVALVRRLFELGIHVPSIIFVSGFGDIDAREVYALGVEAMLAKPLSRQQFLHVLENSLKGRNEMWVDPLQAENMHLVALTFESRETAYATCAFALGRGGCCFATGKALAEDQLIQLSIHFTEENLHLEAHGVVRWYHPKEQRAGVEFTYLIPGSRPWVLEAIKADVRHSFIPNCRPPTETRRPELPPAHSELKCPA